MSDSDAGKPPAEEQSSVAIELIDGLAARREVEGWLALDREAAEQWLRGKIWLAYVESWHSPWFIPLREIEKSQLPGPSNWTFDGLFGNEWEYDLKLVCMTRGSLERALKIGRSARPEDDLWEEIRLDIEQRSGITEWRDSQFEDCRVEDRLQMPAVIGVRFKLAADQVGRASGMPLEIAEEALVAAVNQGMVRAWRNHPGLLEEFGPEWSLTQPVNLETQIDADQLAAWIATTLSTKAAPKGRKRGPKPKEIGLLVTNEATRWAYDEDINPEDRGSLRRIREYIADRLIAHKEDASDETIRQWAHVVLQALQQPKGQ